MSDLLRARDAMFDGYNAGLSQTQPSETPTNFQLTRPDQITVERILRNIDAQFIPQYVVALEKCKGVLSTYAQALAAMNDRVEKGTDGEIRKSAQSSIVSKINAISQTLEKLQAHIDNSKERLSN